ncbi:hypothetical protein GGR97_003042 [Wenyingzhuangia aestuarii]|nr:hypothetical protein [Wenyingzhuangia aestuarii]
MTLGILFTTISYYTYVMYDFAKGVQTDINNKINHFPRDFEVFEKIKDGTWLNLNDSLATVRITKYEWIFKYKGVAIDSTDIYNYNIKTNNNSKTLLLTNRNDTLKYVIENLTTEDLEIIYLPRGNFHSYKRIE